VNRGWFMNCGKNFLCGTIDLIAPKAVVSLGERAYRAIMDAYGLPRIAFRSAVDRPNGFKLPGGSAYLPMYHCGARILNTHRKEPAQKQDWERVKKFLGS
jgi:uracil-DNA glycosylase